MFHVEPTSADELFPEGLVTWVHPCYGYVDALRTGIREPRSGGGSRKATPSPERSSGAGARDSQLALPMPGLPLRSRRRGGG